MYDQPSNASFPSKIESVQNYAALAITGFFRRLILWKTLPGIKTRVSTSQILDQMFKLTVQSSLK